MVYQLPLFEQEPEYKEPTVPEKMQRMLDDPDCKILIAFSGGKDSVAMVLYLLDMGIPKTRIELHHHDVDGHGGNLFDWPCTPSYCQAFADAFELPIVFSWRQGGIRREIYRENEGLQDVYYQTDRLHHLPSRKGNSTRRKFPAVAADLRTRWCSSVVKIDVLSRVVNDRFESGNLLVLTGERRQESAARSKYTEFEKYRSWTKSRNAWQWRPVIDFHEKQVWDLYKKYRVQPHPCYELGWSRCSCQLCIFSSPNTWASINELAPWKIDELAEMEEDLSHTLYNGLHIRQKVAKGRSFLRPDMVRRWGKEVMGEFNSPIFISNWRHPEGAFSRELSGAI